MCCFRLWNKLYQYLFPAPIPALSLVTESVTLSSPVSEEKRKEAQLAAAVRRAEQLKRTIGDPQSRSPPKTKPGPEKPIHKRVLQLRGEALETRNPRYWD